MFRWPPRSSTSTESAVRPVISFAMVSPLQPPPMITMSTGFRVIMETLCLFVFPRPTRVSGDLLETRGFWSPWHPVVLVDITPVIHARARESDQLPADQVHVPTVHR